MFIEMDHTGKALLYSSGTKGAGYKGALHCVKVPSITFVLSDTFLLSVS